MGRFSKSETRVQHETESKMFNISLNISKKDENTSGNVTIYKNESTAMMIYRDNYLSISPDHIPELIKELEWAYDRWKETRL